jgi:hypothetical protein
LTIVSVHDGAPLKANMNSVTTLKANMSIATFLVARGPWAYIGAPLQLISRGNWSDPFFQLYRLDTGKPMGACKEESKGVFTREWSGGRATVDCTAATGSLDFGLLDHEEE